MKQLLLIIFSFTTISAFAQNQSAKPAIKSAAQKMNDALVKKDYRNFVKSTYPKALEHTEGGAEKLIADLTGQIVAMEQSGNKIVKVWPGDASNIIDTAGEWQATIPQYMTIEIPEGTLTTETTLLALSPDKGKTWYFIDAADRTMTELREMFPNISTKLVIKPSPEPVFKATEKK